VLLQSANRFVYTSDSLQYINLRFVVSGMEVAAKMCTPTPSQLGTTYCGTNSTSGCTFLCKYNLYTTGYCNMKRNRCVCDKPCAVEQTVQAPGNQPAAPEKQPTSPEMTRQRSRNKIMTFGSLLCTCVVQISQ
jgi:hypothetical protein